MKRFRERCLAIPPEGGTNAVAVCVTNCYVVGNGGETIFPGEPTVIEPPEENGSVRVNAGVPKVDIATDINNDGIIDSADEPIEESGIGEIVRVNDADDSPGGEDDLQYMQVKIEPTLTQGAVWFTYDTAKVKIWSTLAQTPGTEIAPGSETSPNWNLGTGGTVPDHVYVEGISTTAPNASINVVLHVKVGGAECTDTILYTVTDQVGHYAYFAGVRDYLTEYRGPGAPDFKLFEDQVDAPGGGNFDFRLVAVTCEDKKMEVDNAANSGHEDIFDVLPAYNDAFIIVNGTFFKDIRIIDPWVSRGRLVSAFSVSAPSSQDVEPTDKPEVKGWFGGRLLSLFSPPYYTLGPHFSGAAPNLEPPVHWTPQVGDPYGAVGGLIAEYPTYAGHTIQSIITYSGLDWDSRASDHIGIDSDEKVLFVLAKKNAGNDFAAAITLHQLLSNLVTSGADRLCGLDGGGSVALAHTDRLGANLSVVEAAGRHTHEPIYAVSYYVHNYIIIK